MPNSSHGKTGRNKYPIKNCAINIIRISIFRSTVFTGMFSFFGYMRAKKMRPRFSSGSHPKKQRSNYFAAGFAG